LTGAVALAEQEPWETEMTFDEIFTQVVATLQRQGRVSYGALKRRFTLDDTYLQDLKDELIEAQQLAVNEDQRLCRP
jgi:hypothetical protein